MKKYLTLALICVITMMSFAQADSDYKAIAHKEIVQTLSSDEYKSFDLINRNGTINIVGTDDNQIEIKASLVVKGNAQKAIDKIIDKAELSVRKVGKGCEVEVIKFGKRKSKTQVDYVIKVPKSLAVNVSNSNGVISVAELTNGVSIKNSNGTIDVENVVSGAEAKTVNGSINIQNSSGNIKGITINGSVNVIGDGNQMFDINLTTINGSVKLVVSGDFSANVVASTLNGRVNLKGIENLEVDDKKIEKKFRIGNGKHDYELQSINGDVEFRRIDLSEAE